MTELFLKIVNMSITASILVLLVLVLRLMLNKAPKWVNVLLWGLVAIRLICPFGIESSFSLMPKTDWIAEEDVSEEDLYPDSVTQEWFSADSGLKFENNEDLGSQYYPVEPQPQVSSGEKSAFALSCIWLAGIGVMLVYLAFSYIRVYCRIRSAKQFRGNIYTSENVASPFVFGVIRPRICLPENMDAVSMSYVIAHEEAHLRRRDHWWKPLGFLLLTIHWFNPVMWLAYILLCRDIELACDERVVKAYDDTQRADYSEALLECSVKRSMISACPLAFGEVGVKTRIKSVLSYKKPAFWIVVLAVIACAAAAVCFLTNPINRSVISIDEHDWYFERAYIRKLEKDITIEVYQPGLQPKTENAEPVNAILVPGDEPMWYDLITGDWDTNRFGNHFILEKADRKSAHYTVDLYRDNGELYSGVTSTAVIEPMRNGDGYILTIYEKSVGAEKEIIFTTEKQPGAAQGEKKLTLEDVITLSEKNMAITWEDFADYSYTDEGTWNFRCIYEIDDVFWLEVLGGSMHGTPMRINLCTKSEYGDGADYVDIRRTYADEDIVVNFIREHQKNQSESDLQESKETCTVDPPNDVWKLADNGTMLFSGSGEKTLFTPYSFMGYTLSDLQFYEITVENHAFGPLQARIYRTSDDEKIEEFSVGAGETAAFELSAEDIWYMEISSAESDGKTVSFSGSVSLNEEKSATTDWIELVPSALEEAEKTGYVLQPTYARLKTVPHGNEIEIYFLTEDEKKYVGVSYVRESISDYWKMLPENAVNVYDAKALEESEQIDITDNRQEVYIETSEKTLLNIPVPVNDYQNDIRVQAANSIFGAVTVFASGIDKLEQVPTGTVGLSEEILLYRLEYWITKGINGPEGTPPEHVWRETVYFAMFNDRTTGTWSRLGTITEAEIDELYNTPPMLELYGNKYTAAAAEMGRKYSEYTDSELHKSETEAYIASNSDIIMFDLPLSWFIDLAWNAALPIAESETIKIEHDYFNLRHDYNGNTIWIQFYGITETGWDDRYVDITIVRDDEGNYKVDPEGCIVGVNSENIKNATLNVIANYVKNIESVLEVSSSNPDISETSAYEGIMNYNRMLTLEYIFSEFLEGGQTDLHGYVLWQLMMDLLNENEMIAYDAENGQDYFDHWLESARSAEEQHVNTWLEENVPAIALVLKIV